MSTHENTKLKPGDLVQICDNAPRQQLLELYGEKATKPFFVEHIDRSVRYSSDKGGRSPAAVYGNGMLIWAKHVKNVRSIKTAGDA